MNSIPIIISVITCAIGVFTFIAAILSRAKDDGVLVQKINQAIEGIEELKTEVKTVTISTQSLALRINSHEEQIKTLFRMVDSSNTNTQALISIMETLNRMEQRGA